MKDLEFLFLGSGTSAGVPIIGCDCRVCTSSDPRDCRTRPSVCLRFADGDGHDRLILVDASPDLRQQSLRHGLSRCDAILFTHSHVDHTYGLDEVRRFNAVMRSSIDIYAERETMADVERVFRHIFQAHENPNVSFVAKLVKHEIRLERPVDLLGLRFQPIRLLHGRLPVLGFRIDAIDEAGERLAEQPSPLPLAYCTDVSEIPDETWPALVGLRNLVLGMLRYREHPTHFSVDQAVEAAGRIGAPATWFIHMTHDILHAELEEQLPDGMALSYDGLSLR